MSKSETSYNTIVLSLSLLKRYTHLLRKWPFLQQISIVLQSSKSGIQSSLFEIPQIYIILVLDSSLSVTCFIT